MPTTGDRSDSDRSALGRTSKVVLESLTVALLAAASIATSCAPGSLPSDFHPAGQGGTGGMGGAPTGGMGGGGMDAAPVGDVLVRPLANCAAYGTVGDFETKFLGPKCGTMVGCHQPGSPFPPDLLTASAYARLIDKAVSSPGTVCSTTKDKLVDSSLAPEDTYLVAKVRDKMPKCNPTGPVGGAQMPFGMPALPQSDIDCTIAYVKAILNK
jgi:hypothetical protein